MESFKVGDKVRILEGTKQIAWNSDGKMEKYIGTKGVITKIMSSESKYRVVCDLDSDFWFFNKEDLEKVENMDKMKEFTKSDLKEFDIVVMRNTKRYVYFQEEFQSKIEDLFLNDYYVHLLRSDKTNEYDIMQVIRNNEVIWERIEKSPLQIELESLEQQQREIADKIAELSKKM